MADAATEADLKSRAEATAQGLKIYRSARPCRFGHALRSLNDGHCKECSPAQQKLLRDEKRHAKTGAHDAWFRARGLNALCTCCSFSSFYTIYSKSSQTIHIDHIVPLAAGGKHCLDNLQALYAAEHRQKTSDEIKIRNSLKMFELIA